MNHGEIFIFQGLLYSQPIWKSMHQVFLNRSKSWIISFQGVKSSGKKMKQCMCMSHQHLQSQVTYMKKKQKISWRDSPANMRYF